MMGSRQSFGHWLANRIDVAQMILNHKAAIELLVEQADEIGCNRYTLLNLHALRSKNLMADRMASGRLRTIPVGIGGTVYHPPYLQPFEDVNTGVSRLAANIPLIQRNLCPLSFVGLPAREWACLAESKSGYLQR